MRCPRCHRELGDDAPAFCDACGAPLRLRDEAAARALDAPVALDRRGGDEASRESELAVLERSHWDLRGSAVGSATGSAAAVAPASPRGEQSLPDADVEPFEIRLRRPATWRRAAAWAVDAIPFVSGGVALARALVREASAGLPATATGLDGLLDLAARERVIVISIAAAVALALCVYTTLAHALAGATLGKRLLGLRLVGPDGGPPTMARSATRSALAALSAALLGLGFLLALFTRSGRALHDLLARTWVVEAP